MNHKANPGYQPPASPEAEQSVLGSILVSFRVLDEICDTLSEDDFYRPAHARIFHAMMDLYGAEEPVDLRTVTQCLLDRNQLEGAGGPLFLMQLSEQVGFSTNATYYAKIVREKAMLRRLLDTAQQIAGACLGPVESVPDLINDAESKLFQVVANQKTQAQSLTDLVPVEEARIEALHNRKNQIIGLPTGFTDVV